MKVYFSCSLTGGRNDQPVYAAIVEGLLLAGHLVPTAGLAYPEAMDDEARVEPRAVYARDIAWLDECQAVIAEVSTPSHGVGYEIAYALLAGKPVLCLWREGARVSKMLTGNTHPGLRCGAYREPAQAVEIVAGFLGGLAGR